MEIWVPPFPQRFKDAIQLAVELSGFAAEWWEETMRDSLRWVAELEVGNEIIPENLGDQNSGYVSGLLLAYLGSTPPDELAREFDRRLVTMGQVEHPRDGIPLAADAKYYSAEPAEALDQVERTRKTWETIRAIVAAFDPAKPKA